MSSGKKITLKVVEGLEKKQIVWDTAVRGFYARRQAEAVTYGIKRRIDGRARWLSIGEHGAPWTVETARAKALELLGAIAKGENPAAVRDFEQGLPTVKEAAEAFLKEHVEEKRKGSTATGYEVLIRLHINPNLGKTRIDRVTPDSVEAMHRKIKSRTQANRAAAVLSRLMTFAARKKWVKPGFNPVKGLERYEEKSRERFLSADELGRLGEAMTAAVVDGESPFAIAALRLLILTGCRKDEILTLRWEYVDAERGLLLLPDSKTGKKAVVLNAPALQLLSELSRVHGNPFVIVGDRDGGHLIGLHRIWNRVRVAAKLPEVRIHDLRHSFASVAAAKGGSLPMIGRLLGHSVPATTQRYAHLAKDPLKELTDATGHHLASAIGIVTVAKTAEVISADELERERRKRA